MQKNANKIVSAPLAATPENISKAAERLRQGGLVAFPTETVYGLGGNARDDAAVRAIFHTKGRPSTNPLIVHCDTPERLEGDVIFTPLAKVLTDAFWPGPLTVVLPREKYSRLSLLVSAGGDTVAVRVPGHPIAQALLKEAGIPIAAPSANPSGQVSPTTAAHVAQSLVTQSLPATGIWVLDGGACPVGIESTVVDCTGPAPVILRPGSITAEEIARVAGEVKQPAGNFTGVLRSPGLLERHYAPSLPLRLNATNVHSGEALIAFGQNAIAGAAKTVNLSRSGDLQEAARGLFAALRELDRLGIYSGIAVMAIPEEGIGIAINDRLRRAAKR